jgi:hypothetical protein
MSAATDNQTPRAVGWIYPPLVLIAFSIVMIVWSYDYGEIARSVPLLVGYSLLVLSVIDLLSRFDLPFSGLLRAFWGADFRDREMKHDPTWTAELAQFLWVTGCVAGMLLIGILPTIPLFVMLFMAIHGRRRWLESAVVAAMALGFVFVVFEVLLDYQLYRGALFDPRGFAGW